jgi:hypothetical protein
VDELETGSFLLPMSELSVGEITNETSKDLMKVDIGHP